MAREIFQNQVYGANSGNFTGKSTIDVPIAIGLGTLINIEQTVQKKVTNDYYTDFKLDGIGYFASNDEFRYVIKVTSKSDEVVSKIKIVDAVPSSLEFLQEDITCKSINSNDSKDVSDVTLTFATEKPEENKEKQYDKTTIEIAQMEARHYLEIYIPVKVKAIETVAPEFGSSIVTQETPGSGEGTGEGTGSGESNTDEPV